MCLLHILCFTYYYCKYIYRLILPLLIRFAHSLLSPVYFYGDNAGGRGGEGREVHFFRFMSKGVKFSRLSTLHFLTFYFDGMITSLSFHASSYFVFLILYPYIHYHTIDNRKSVT